MRTYVLEPGHQGLEALRQAEIATPVPGPGEILIRVRACSLNYRDQLLIQGRYFGGPIRTAAIPLSDGAGEVAAIGAGVTRFAVGDRVAGTFFLDWEDGPADARKVATSLGAPPATGMLAEYALLPERAVVPIAPSLSFEEAATLPCAGVTAWNALTEGPRRLQPGDTVLLLGTGGVSLIALQLARAAGAAVIITSSSDAKLERARAMGATHGINYRATPDWGAAAAQAAGPNGISHIVEVGGPGTIAQSIQAIGYGGEIGIIGLLAAEGQSNPLALMTRGATMRGIFVGSRAMAERLNAAVEANGIRPVIDRVFAFADAVDAYRYQSGSDLFGKVVISV